MSPVSLKSTLSLSHRFYEVNNVNHFQFSRGVHKGQVNKDNEFSVSLLLVGCFDELRFILTDNLVLVNELIKQSGLCNEVLKVTLRALAFFQWTRVDARNDCFRNSIQ